MVRAISAIANNGTLITPHLLLENTEDNKKFFITDIKKRTL